MKNQIKYLFGSLVIAGAMVACSPEEFAGEMEEAGIVQASAYSDQISISVDQETNQVTMTLNNAQGVYPYWKYEVGTDKNGEMQYEHSTVNGHKHIFALAGDYKIMCYIGNKHGIGKVYVEKSVHIDRTIVDFSPYIKKLAKAPWYINNEEQGHLGCGPSGTIGLEWWSAAPNDKAAWGVYDCSLTFDDNSGYTFNAGPSGTIYVNEGVSMWPEENVLKDENGKAIDFVHAVPEPQVSSYSIEVVGNDLYLVFPEHTYFPYIANDEIWNEPRYKIVNIDGTSMELVIDNGNIAWHYLLTNSKEAKFPGFTYDQPANIWKNIQVEAGGIYYADAGWSAYPNNGDATFEVSNSEVNIVLPLATASQWQAQFPIATNIGPGSEYMSSSNHYDFSCIIRSNKDLKGMTLKLVESGDNGVPGSLGIAYDSNAVFYDNSSDLNAGEDYVFYLVDQPGVDIQDNHLQLVLDFGGCEAGTEISIKNIVLIDHAQNNELDLIPSSTPSDNPALNYDWQYNSPDNLWKSFSPSLEEVYIGDANWGAYPADQHSLEFDVDKILFHIVPATDAQWKSQLKINTGITSLDPSKKYDFHCKFHANQDLNNVTVKLCELGPNSTPGSLGINYDSNTLLYSTDTNLEEDTDVVFALLEQQGITLQDNPLMIVFDFGGNAADFEVEISEIIIQEHK